MPDSNVVKENDDSKIRPVKNHQSKPLSISNKPNMKNFFSEPENNRNKFSE